MSSSFVGSSRVGLPEPKPLATASVSAIVSSTATGAVTASSTGASA